MKYLLYNKVNINRNVTTDGIPSIFRWRENQGDP